MRRTVGSLSPHDVLCVLSPYERLLATQALRGEAERLRAASEPDAARGCAALRERVSLAPHRPACDPRLVLWFTPGAVRAHRNGTEDPLPVGVSDEDLALAAAQLLEEELLLDGELGVALDNAMRRIVARAVELHPAEGQGA